jgi:hypothetical protein
MIGVRDERKFGVPEEGSRVFLRNIVNHLTDYTAS